MLLIFFVYTLFASTFTVGKEALLYISPIFLTGFRMITAGALSLAFVKLYKKQSFHIKPEHFVWIAMVAVLQFYLSFTLEFVSLNYLTSAKTCLLFNLSPFVTALFSYIFFKEIMTPKKWLGFIIGFAGFFPILRAQAPASEKVLGYFGFISWPEIMMFGSVVSSCAGWIALRKLTREYNHCYFFINGLGMLIGGILALLTAYFLETPPTLEALTAWPFINSFWYLIIIGNFVCFNLYSKLLQTYSATILSFFGFFTPLFAALLDWLWFGQIVQIEFFITVAIVAFGLYLFYQEELKQGYIVK